MDQANLVMRIREAFDGMSEQLRSAARYVLDHPEDVALLSMREQARRAGVQPSTMTRLAQHLGLGGYDRLRDIHAAHLRGAGSGFAGRGGIQVAKQRLRGDQALVADILQSIASQVARLGAPASMERMVAAATALSAARRVYCLGLRSSHAIAWQLHYAMSLLGEKSILLDGIGGTGGDALRHAGRDDVLVVASVLPYTRLAVELAGFAAERAVTVVAITDSEVAPLAELADHLVLVPTASPAFLHSMTPAFIVAEVLGALVAGHAGKEAIEALRRFDEQGTALNTHLLPRRSPSRQRAMQ